MINEYETLVFLCNKSRLDFDIPCSSVVHRKFILDVVGSYNSLEIEDVEYIIGDKYFIMVIHHKLEKAFANFNVKKLWKSLHILMDVHNRVMDIGK